MRKIKVDIFIPAYNEKEILQKFVIGLRKHLARGIPGVSSTKITVVNDNSDDISWAELDQMGHKFDFSTAMFSVGPSRRENLGRAMSKSKADILMFLDADILSDYKHIDEAIAILEEGNDIVIGSRYLPGAVCKRGLARFAISKMYNAFIRIFLKSKIYDHQCGLKVFNRSTYLKIYSKLGYDKSFSRGWFWDAELLIHAQRMKYKIKEIPIFWQDSGRSSFRITREISMVPYILRFCLKKR